jgi:thiamine biosynthesis lipoprotein
METPASLAPEQREFAALGGIVTIEARGDRAAAAVDRAEAAIRNLQESLTRFEPNSELSRLNADRRTTVPASPIMVRFAGTVSLAGHLSGGLVDSTVIDAVERAGYTRSLGKHGVPSQISALAASASADEIRPAAADPRRRWVAVSADADRGTVTRPPGTRLDSGGTGKGLAADVGAEQLEGLDSWAIGCIGDIRFGGTGGIEREVLVSSPFPGAGPLDAEPLASLHLPSGAVATSGITRRSWIDPEGKVAHHLINPAAGRPAWTGVVQVTAIAPDGVEAEVRAKAALLSGPDQARGWLVHGGAVVLESGEIQLVEGDDGVTVRSS